MVNHGWQSEPTEGPKRGWNVRVSIYPSIYLLIYLSLFLSLHLLFAHLSVSLSIFLSVYLPVYLSIVCLQPGKRSFPARRPYFWTLTISKTKQFCETSSICEVDSIQNEVSLRDFVNFLNLTPSKKGQISETSFKSGKLRGELTASYQGVSRFFPLHLSKGLRLPRKSEARSYEVLHLSRKIIFPKLKI